LQVGRDYSSQGIEGQVHFVALADDFDGIAVLSDSRLSVS